MRKRRYEVWNTTEGTFETLTPKQLNKMYAGWNNLLRQVACLEKGEYLWFCGKRFKCVD